MKKQLKGMFLLLLTAVIWGSAFVAQDISVGMLGPFTFQATRTLLGFVTLLPVIVLRDRADFDPQKKEKAQKQRKDLLLYGALCGVILFAACNLQQFGLQDTTAGKSGFITALYIVLVPVVNLLFGKKSSMKLWLAVVLALFGLFFLCVEKGSFTIGRGEVLTLLCSLCFTAHILIIDHISAKVDGVRLSALQFLFSGLLALVCMFLTEAPTWQEIFRCWGPICYAGILSCGVAYTLQIIAQKDVNPTLASITMSMESVFAVLCGWVVLGDKLSLREGLGCVLMFMGIILAQLPQKKRIKA